MKIIVLAVCCLVLLAEGVGVEVRRRFRAGKEGYSAPLGMAAIFALCQIGYYPIQYFNGSYRALCFVTGFVFLIALICTIRNRKEVFAEIARKRTWIVLGALALFCAVFYFCYVDMEFADSPMYLNYISQNIGADRINLFNLYTGKTGAEWDSLYLWQGYYHFNAVWIGLLNLPHRLGLAGEVETLKGVVWSMGMLYSVVSSMLIVDVVESVKLKSKSSKIILLVFALFYLNFYYYRIVSAWYGNTWRTLFIMLLMVQIARWLSGHEEMRVTWLFAMISFAGIACSSSYLFISFALLSILAAFLFLKGRKGSLLAMSWFVLPLAVYASVMTSRNSLLGYVAGAFFLVYYLSCSTRFVTRILGAVEQWLIRHAKVLFFVVLPIGSMVFALVLHFTQPDFLYGYAYWFRDHQTVDMVKDYFFVYSTWYDNLINVLRWAGIVLLFVQKDERTSMQWLRTTVALMLVVFVNPLSTPTIAYTIASNVFYRSWEVLFNPFTEIVFFSLLLESDRSWLRNGTKIVLVFVLLVSNALALRGDKKAAYGFYIDGGRNVGHLNKMEPAALEAIEALKMELETRTKEGQPVVISQAEGTRVYLPQVIQLITARDTYYTDVHVNEDLYQIARRHHDWEEKDETIPYENTCALLKEQGTEYVLVRYWENPEFDEAMKACTVDLYQNMYFRLKKVEE